MKTIVLLFIVLASCGHALASELSLLSEGKSDYQIVVPDKLPTPALTECLNQTARLVQTAFKANGTQVNLVTESQRDSAKPAIYLGNTTFAQQHGVDMAKLEGWSYVQRVVSYVRLKNDPARG